MAGNGTDEIPEETRNLLPDELFQNPILSALRGTHRPLAQTQGQAMRYMAEVAPFAAVSVELPAAYEGLANLLQAEERVWLIAKTPPQTTALQHQQTIPCLQMVLPSETAALETSDAIEELGPSQAGEMLALIAVAFPGFFRRRTPEMGRYFGIRRAGQLIAMGGERLRMPGYAEISGLCTRPEHRGRGYAASLLGHLGQLHRSEGLVSFLHVGTANLSAIQLYQRLGFRAARVLQFHQLRRRVS